MKKFIVLFLAGVLIFALGATVYAQAPKLEFRASGFIDVQSFIGENVPQYNTGAGLWSVVDPNYSLGAGKGFGLGSPGYNKTQSNWESRAHLKFDAVMGPNLSGTIYFEIDTFRGGSTWAGYPGAGREANNFGGWSTDRVAVEVKNIYIDVGLPYFGLPVPISARVGAQPIGVRPNVLVYTDGFGITGGIKIDPVMIIPIYAKPLEGLDFAADDVDVWGLHANAKVGTFTVGGYGLWYNMATYPFFVPVANVNVPTSLWTTTLGSYRASMWWIGAYADGKAGPVNVNFDFVYDLGYADDKLGTPQPHVRYQGWMLRGKIDFPWEKFNFGMVGMYATGNDANKTSTNGLPGSTTGNGSISRRVSSYVVPPASENGPANGESVVVYSMEPGATGGYGIANNANYGQVSRGAFGGTWFAKLYGSAKLTPWYKVTVQGLYIGDTTSHGDTFGNAIYPATGQLKSSNTIGMELDLIQEIWIYRNLRFFMGFGYLFAGGALDIRQGTTFFNQHPANPWAFRTRLQYTF